MESISEFQRLKPGPRTDTEQVAEHQKDRLRHAMVRLASSRGYQRVTLKELAKLAGVSTRSIYLLYSGKEECFVETFEVLAKNALETMIWAQEPHQGREERLRTAVHAMTVQVCSHPATARVLLLESTSAGGRALATHHRAVKAFGEVLAGGPESAGSVPPLARHIVASGLVGVCERKLIAGTQSDLPSIAEDLSRWAALYFSTSRRHSRPGDEPVLRGRVDELRRSIRALCGELDQVRLERGARSPRHHHDFPTETVLAKITEDASRILSLTGLAVEASVYAATNFLRDGLAADGTSLPKLAGLMTYVITAPAGPRGRTKASATDRDRKPKRRCPLQERSNHSGSLERQSGAIEDGQPRSLGARPHYEREARL